MALQSKISYNQNGHIVKTLMEKPVIRRRYISTRALKNGMIIDQAIIDKTGRILIARKTELDEFLIDALRVIDDETVNIYMVNSKAPCFIRDEEASYIYLILPVNFNRA